MTLKLRLTAMMVLLLVAVMALQFLLAERERRTMEDRLSALGSGVARSTREVVERTHEMIWSSAPDSALKVIAIVGSDSAGLRANVDTRVFVSQHLNPGQVGRVEMRETLLVRSGTPPPGEPLVMLRGDTTGGARTDLVVNLPLPIGGRDSLYAMEMRFSTGALTQELERSRRRSFLWMGALVGVAVLGAAALATQFTRPIQDLRASFHRVEEGNLDVTVTPRRHDEIGQLTESFNEMVVRLRESRAMEDRLVEAEKMAAIGRIAAGVAHEVRNPLNAILLTLEQIRDKAASPELDRYHAIVRTELLRLEKMVGTFLDLSRAADIARERHDATFALSSCVELFRPAANERGITLEARVEGPLLIIGDPARLPTVWNNLLSNALAAARTRVVVTARREDGGFLAQIDDDGAGIAQEDLDRVWEPFFSRKPEGIGLGLPLVRSVVEAHGGRVSLASAPGTGTRATVWIPSGGAA